ncbi:MAG: hypothetical protein RL701_7335 [Pseudomonadota bacterium]|jgi:hypothetical protein
MVSTRSARTLSGALLLCGLSGSLGPSLHVSADDPGRFKKPGECVLVTTEASFASVGYDHIVTLKSTCQQHHSCSVKTNVNPEVARVELDPGESQSVVTWRGSPAREFSADVKCKPSR